MKTIYIGGGTPLSLSCEDLENLFVFVKENFDLSQLEEYSIETTAIEITDKKIKLLKKYGINRLSIGVETLQDNLYYLNRHTDKNKLVEIKSFWML